MKTKECTKCHNKKVLSEFYKDKSKPDGHRPDCKECQKNLRKKYPAKYILRSIHARCYNSKSQNYKWYGKKGIKNYLTEEDIKFLMKRDGYYFMNNPTIDRENSNKNYTLNNCRFIEFKENIKRQDRSHSFKPILQFNTDGSFIKEFESIGQASRDIKTSRCNISDALHNRQKTAKGFIWRYKNA